MQQVPSSSFRLKSVPVQWVSDNRRTDRQTDKVEARPSLISGDLSRLLQKYGGMEQTGVFGCKVTETESECGWRCFAWIYANWCALLFTGWRETVFFCERTPLLAATNEWRTGARVQKKIWRDYENLIMKKGSRSAGLVGFQVAWNVKMFQEMRRFCRVYTKYLINTKAQNANLLR